MKKSAPELDPWAVGWTIRLLVLIAFFTAFAVPMGFVPILAVAPGEVGELPPETGPITIALSTPEPTATPMIYTPTPHVPRIGIIAGHAGSDSGAICPDGLQEVEVNQRIAELVVNLLTQLGWQSDLLDEFDVRLNGYRADALVSIHSDSCNVPGKSGFKVVRAEAGYLPETSEALVDCISRHYEARTGLPFDPHTITYDMTQYHAYYEVDRNTPAVIIEAGFMLDDRELLTQRPEVVAQGIVDGLVCFVEGESTE
jgi:N-acetylmuramoyl-L-alanine amidase